MMAISALYAVRVLLDVLLCFQQDVFLLALGFDEIKCKQYFLYVQYISYYSLWYITFVAYTRKQIFQMFSLLAAHILSFLSLFFFPSLSEKWQTGKKLWQEF